MTSDNQSKKIVSVSKEVIWEISNCSTSFFTEYENGEFITSDPFCVYNGNMFTKWRLRLYPNGRKEESKSNISLFLHFDVEESSELVDFEVKFLMKIVNNDSEKSVTGKKNQRSLKELEEFSGYGRSEFLSHLELDDGFINDRKLKIVVQITVEFKVKTNKPNPPIMKIEPKTSLKIWNDLRKMFDNDALTDFEINTNDGEVLKGHKFILAARSPMFYAMFTTEMKESESCSADIPDFNSKIMKEVLRFIYCDEVENLNDLASELIFAAEKYQLKELKTACVQSLISTLQVNSKAVVKFIKIAQLVPEADELFEKCLDLIVSDFSNVIETQEWEELPQSLTLKIVKEMIDRFNVFNLSSIAK